MRITPNTSSAQRSTAAAPAAATSATVAAPAPTVSPILAAILAADPADRETVAADQVRELSTSARQKLAIALLTSAPELAPIAPIIVNAPSGPDPRQTIAEHLAAMVERLAAFTRGAVECEHLAADVDVPGMVAAALSRVAPNTAHVAAVLAPRTGRTRRNVERDWSRASGEYVTPGRNGSNGATVRVTVRQGAPTFTTADGQTFDNATAALRHADGWEHDRGGWGNPFTVLRDNKRQTLGARAPERSS